MKFFLRPSRAKDEQFAESEEVLFQHRVVFLDGALVPSPGSASGYSNFPITNALLALDSLNNSPIKLVIDSPGGAISTGFTLYDTMRSLRSPVYTIGRCCSSMAAIILAAGDPGHRYVYPHSQIMLHLPWGMVQGDVNELAIQQRELERIKNQLVAMLQECGVHRTTEEILADIDKAKWMNGEEAIAYGLADKIVERGDI